MTAHELDQAVGREIAQSFYRTLEKLGTGMPIGPSAMSQQQPPAQSSGVPVAGPKPMSPLPSPAMGAMRQAGK